MSPDDSPPGDPDDLDYYESRAEAELALAQRAAHVRAVQAHYDLANLYLDRIHGETGKAGKQSA